MTNASLAVEHTDPLRRTLSPKRVAAMATLLYSVGRTTFRLIFRSLQPVSNEVDMRLHRGAGFFRTARANRLAHRAMLQQE
jgi:hypothetical protein